MAAAGPANDPLAPLRADPGHSAVLLDFDGSLSPIVLDPATARPVAGAVDVLGALADRFAVVAVVSGRPVSFLGPLLPAAVRVSGLYGLEELVDGVRTDHPEAGAWREVVGDVAGAIEAHGPLGAAVERKGLSLTVHFRAHPELEDEVRAFAAKQAARSGLVVRPAKMSVELHPPVAVDKGAVVDDLTAGCRAACYVGDDMGDLPAFAALDRLAGLGVHTVRVAVTGEEAPAALLDRADIVVDGPAGALDLLRSLC